MDFFLLKSPSSSSTFSFVGTRKAGKQVVWMAGVDDIPRGRLERARFPRSHSVAVWIPIDDLYVQSIRSIGILAAA